MSEKATLQLVYEGKSNVLRICRGAVAGVRSVVVDCCKKDLPGSQDDASDCLNRLKSHVGNAVPQSTDFVCSYNDCGYHNKLETKYILHARSHFVFEVTPDAAYDTVLKYSKGKYMCSKCPRSTSDWISFREHIRHHIFEKPYRCSKCMLPIGSVPDLRIHFQKCHAGKQTDFVFSGGVYEINTLLTMLLPETAKIKEPLDVSFKVTEHIKTRISCTSVSAESHPVILLRQLLVSNQWLDLEQGLSSSDRSSFPDHSCVLKLVPGKYEYSDGIYACVACCYRTNKEEAFSCHAWKHIHGSWISICAHNTSGQLSSECAIVNGLIKMLKRVALNQVADILKKNSICGTKSQAHSQSSKALENVSSMVSIENSKFAFTVILPFRISKMWSGLK